MESCDSVGCRPDVRKAATIAAAIGQSTWLADSMYPLVKYGSHSQLCLSPVGLHPARDFPDVVFENSMPNGVKDLYSSMLDIWGSKVPQMLV